MDSVITKSMAFTEMVVVVVMEMVRHWRNENAHEDQALANVTFLAAFHSQHTEFQGLAQYMLL